MRDPHVEELIYELKQMVDYKDPSPVKTELGDFRIKLIDGILNVEIQKHCSSVDAARQIVEPYLRTWETDAFLKSGNEDLLFEFSDSNVIDRDPPGPGESDVIHANAMLQDKPAIISAKATIPKEAYPQPPIYKALSPDAKTLIDRYRRYRNGEEPLPGMSYFCLTVIEARSSKNASNKRKSAANNCCLDYDILDKIGKFSSTRGDSNSSRKFNPSQKELTSNEQTWLDSAIRHITTQLAAVDAGKKPNKLKMSDLPHLQ